MYPNYREVENRAREVELRHRYTPTIEAALLERGLSPRTSLRAKLTAFFTLIVNQMKPSNPTPNPCETSEMRAAGA